METRRILNVIVAMALAVVTISCEKGADIEVIDSTIGIEGDRLVTKSSDMLAFEINYKVEGKRAGERVTASCEADWVSFPGTEETLGTIPVLISENRTGSDRTALVTLSLNGAKDAFLTIMQTANPDYRVNRTLKFDLDVAEIESSSCFITVSPSNAASYFYYGIVTADRYDGYESDEAFVAEYVGAIVERAKTEGDGENYSIEKYLNKGYVSHEVSGLSPDTDFCLVAFDLSLGAEYSGAVAIHRFSTRPMAPSSWEFDITVDDNANVTVRPKDGFEGKYVLDVVSLSMWNSYGNPKTAAKDFIAWVHKSDYNISRFMHEGEYSAAYYNPSADIGNIGTGDFVAYAFGCDGAKVTSGVSYVQFHFVEPR